MSDIDAMRRTAAADMQCNFEKVVAENPLKIDTARAATATFFVDADYVKIWNKQLTKSEDENKDYLSPKERSQFMEHLMLQYSKLTTDKMDPLTRVFVRSYTTDRKDIDWFTRWPACIVSNFKEPGTFGCIDGVPRSGKTSLACTFMKLMYEEFRLESITNIELDNTPEYIHHGTQLSEILRFIIDLKRWVLVLDETATFADRKRAMSETNIDFENLNRFIGKQGGSLLMITHSFDKDVPTRLQQWCTEQYSKTSLKNMKCYLKGKNYKGLHTVSGIPDYEGFHTHATTSLGYDISFAKFLDLVQRHKTPSDALNELIKKEQPKVTLKSQVLALVGKGLTHKEIANALGTSKQVVDNYCSQTN